MGETKGDNEDKGAAKPAPTTKDGEKKNGNDDKGAAKPAETKKDGEKKSGNDDNGAAKPAETKKDGKKTSGKLEPQTFAEDYFKGQCVKDTAKNAEKKKKVERLYALLTGQLPARAGDSNYSLAFGVTVFFSLFAGGIFLRKAMLRTHQRGEADDQHLSGTDSETGLIE